MKQTLASTIFSILFFVSGLSASASPLYSLDVPLTETDTNEVQVEIEGIDPDSGLVSALTEIIAVSTQEATKLAARIAEVEALVEAGTLTEEEGEARVEALEAEFEAKMERFGEGMEEWSDEFSDKMDAWGEEFSKKWEERAEELDESVSDRVEGDIELKLDFDNDEEEEEANNSVKVKFDSFEFHIGANSFRTMDGNDAASNAYLSPLQSLTGRSFLGVKRRIFGPKSPLVIQSGIGFESLGWSFNNDRIIVKSVVDPSSASTSEIVPIENISGVRRNRWDQFYIELPVMLHLDFSKGNVVDQGLSLGVGGFAGLRTSSQSIVHGADSDGDRVINRTISGYNTHLVRYGLQAQAGFKKIKLTGRLDAQAFFRPGTFEEEVVVGSLALGFVL